MSAGKIRVAILMGGLSAERNVSLSTGKQILESLDPDKYEAFGVDAANLSGGQKQCLPGVDFEVDAIKAARDAVSGSSKLVSMASLVSENGKKRPDVAFIALHGKYGEDGTIQGMLELLGLPYTGSGVLASALAMDKSMAKKILKADGIKVPDSIDFACKAGEFNENEVLRVVSEIGYPVMVKPSRQGSSIGMSKVDTEADLINSIKEAVKYDSQILIEKFIIGKELTVSVLGNDELMALPVVEIVPASGTYDYESKYTPGATDEIVPARISDLETEKAKKIAVAAHKSLGCRGVSRVDILLCEDDMYVLEVNTIPGMTPTSLLPRAAQAAGIDFSSLLDMLIGYALEEVDTD